MQELKANVSLADETYEMNRGMCWICLPSNPPLLTAQGDAILQATKQLHFFFVHMKLDRT
jgi:hypothetical protein